MSLDEKRGTSIERHAQTVLVLVLVALLLWVGSTTQSTQVAVAQLSVEIEHMKRELQKPEKKFAEIERRLDAIEKALNVHMNRAGDVHD